MMEMERKYKILKNIVRKLLTEQPQSSETKKYFRTSQQVKKKNNNLL